MAVHFFGSQQKNLNAMSKGHEKKCSSFEENKLLLKFKYTSGAQELATETSCRGKMKENVFCL